MTEIAPVPGELRDVVLAVIIRAGRVLIARRRLHDPFGGFWELPGGKRMPGESVRECLAREVMEELGVRIRPGHEFPPIIHAYPDRIVRLLAIVSEIADATDPRPLAADCLEWATAEQLPSYRFPPANAPLIERIVRYLHATDERL